MFLFVRLNVKVHKENEKYRCIDQQQAGYKDRESAIRTQGTYCVCDTENELSLECRKKNDILVK